MVMVEGQALTTCMREEKDFKLGGMTPVSGSNHVYSCPIRWAEASQFITTSFPGHNYMYVVREQNLTFL